MPDERLPQNGSDAQSQPPVVLYQGPLGGCALRLTLHGGDQELRASATLGEEAASLEAADLLVLLEKLGVQGRVDSDAVGRFCAGARGGEAQQDVLLAVGVPPAKGPDGRLEFHVRPTATEPRYENDEHGNVDYHNLHLFDNVTPGDAIATAHPPERGEPGATVMGQSIPGLMGDPHLALAGANVRAQEQEGGRTFVATGAGRVVFQSNVISVTDVYRVDGDVDFNVGHIEFVGSVTIGGNVLDGFNVKAGTGLTILGNVGACRIECGGDVTIGGISGKGAASVKCGGNLSVRYIDDATVECEGSVQIAKEMLNATVRCRGRLEVSLGAIVGGECVALEGIEVKEAGSAANVNTHLTAGVDYTSLSELETIRGQIDFMARKEAKINQDLAPLLHQAKDFDKLPEHSRTRLAGLLTALKDVKALSEELKAKEEQIKTRAAQRANAMINVVSVLNRGVVVTLERVTEQVLEPVRGPVTVLANRKEGGLRYTRMRPLTTDAKKLQESIEQQEEAAARRAEAMRQQEEARRRAAAEREARHKAEQEAKRMQEEDARRRAEQADLDKPDEEAPGSGRHDG
ncbi:MAG: DUF342 domain-containing protein [Kiritimatiellae bacterium]|nr:DUF342 domain-containing protein [Kiritimatiellia bacterium]